MACKATPIRWCFHADIDAKPGEDDHFHVSFADVEVAGRLQVGVTAAMIVAMGKDLTPKARDAKASLIPLPVGSFKPDGCTSTELTTKVDFHSERPEADEVRTANEVGSRLIPSEVLNQAMHSAVLR